MIKVVLTLISMALLMAYSACAKSQERITLADGSRLSVFIVPPLANAESTSADATSPLLILMGGGPGNASISQDTSRWLGSGFAQRGWYVVVPISPTNRSFRSSDNAAKIEMLITELQKRDEVADGKVLLAGVSNGGMSALGIAARKPENYLGVAAVPALVGSGNTLNTLKDFPIYLRIGGVDSLGWANDFEETVSRLKEIGVTLDAGVIEGAPHMFRMDWGSLDPWLESIQ